MDLNFAFDKTPLPLMYIITTAIVFLSITIGFKLGSYIRQHKKNKKEAPTGTIIGSMLGLLAFILAFTFGLAASRYDSRKQLLLDEVNAIGTAYLRTDFLPEPEGSESRKVLKRYVDIRLEVAGNPAELSKAQVESEELHSQLWSQVTSLSRKNNNSVLFGLYAQSLNEVIDLQEKRLTVGLVYRIPGSIWMALYFVTILTMFSVGYDFGHNRGGGFLISLILSLVFSAILLLVLDLDRGREGMFKLNQKPMVELQKKLRLSVK